MKNQITRRLALICALSMSIGACSPGFNRVISSANKAVDGRSNTNTGIPDASPTPQPRAVITPWKSVCGDITGVAGATYCAYTNSPTPQQTIWFFHGLADSPSVFTEALQGTSVLISRDSYLELLQNLPAVKIVAISYGLSWLLNLNPVRTQDPVNATVDVFTSQIMPFIEKTLQPPRPYLAMGHSMGGFNTATLCAALPDMWSKCVLLNAMIPETTCNPFLDNFCNAGPGMVVRGNFTAADWDAYSPFALLKKAKKLPKSFVTACAKDDFGLFAGPQAWSTQASAGGFDSTFYPVMTGCDHVHWPAKKVIEFMQGN